jgi:ribonuclease VapC
MSQVVFDSSALLAYFNGEPGADLVLTLVPDAIISSVNAAEVQSRQVREGEPPLSAWTNILTAVQGIVPFDAAQAEIAGSLIRQTLPYGLSLGDRACLALALTAGCAVYTADRAWSQLQVGVPIHLVR